MLLRVLGEVLAGLMAAGIVVAIAIPVIGQFGYEPQYWLAWAVAAGSIAASVVIGERLNKRRRARGSP